jgi:hypothetical protein
MVGLSSALIFPWNRHNMTLIEAYQYTNAMVTRMNLIINYIL